MGEYEEAAEGNGSVCDEERVTEWEIGLPSGEDLAPLCQLLIPPYLASAFRVSPEALWSTRDVNRASETTMSELLHDGGSAKTEERIGSEPKKQRAAEEERTAVKRQRVVWTPQLHRRFLDVVGHLGVKNAVPKTITQMMNVEGLTRESVASHLQKYRIYLKQKQGLSDDATSSSSSGGGKQVGPSVPVRLPYGGGPVMPVAVFGHMGMQGFHHHLHHGRAPNHRNHHHQSPLNGITESSNFDS